jgi:hypothetical protein
VQGEGESWVAGRQPSYRKSCHIIRTGAGPGPGAIWVAPGAIWVAPGAIWVAAGAIWVAAGAIWVAPGAIWVAPGAIWVAPGAIWVARHPRVECWVAGRQPSI